ncbi:hypothetical protein RZN22_13325 [Bacillaceae bacterium S4-13-58]
MLAGAGRRGGERWRVLAGGAGVGVGRDGSHVEFCKLLGGDFRFYFIETFNKNLLPNQSYMGDSLYLSKL